MSILVRLFPDIFAVLVFILDWMTFRNRGELKTAEEYFEIVRISLEVKSLDSMRKDESMRLIGDRITDRHTSRIILSSSIASLSGTICLAYILNQVDIIIWIAIVWIILYIITQKIMPNSPIGNLRDRKNRYYKYLTFFSLYILFNVTIKLFLFL